MKRVAYIGGQPIRGFNAVWGGSTATNYAFQTAFKKDNEYCIDLLPRERCANADVIRSFCKGADVVHLDDTRIAGIMYEARLQADVIGPITRSPVKNYYGWTCPYSAEWFYSARVIRLNYQEEHNDRDKVTLIVHGVDSERLQPTASGATVLWAGQQNRYAKNYPLWQETRAMLDYAITDTMTGYPVCDYWKALQSAAVYVCTSHYESFCSAAFEAMASGVPVVWRKRLQGGVHEAAGVRVEYTPHGFVNGIKHVLANLPRYRREAREYVENHCTLKHMRDSYAAVYREVLDAKKV